MNLHHHLAADYLAEDIETGSARSFWDYVDSRAIGYPRPGAWTDERGSYCVAAKSDRDRCGQLAHVGPFCSLHMERARTWFRAYDLAEAKRIGAGLAGAASIDDAQRLVEQARRVLDGNPEDRVYFYELAGHGLVKIGTSNRVESRIASFRSGRGCKFPSDVDPSTGRLIGATPGGRALEQHLHRIHRKNRVVGEWFRLTDELAEEIADLIQVDTA